MPGFPPHLNYKPSLASKQFLPPPSPVTTHRTLCNGFYSVVTSNMVDHKNVHVLVGLHSEMLPKDEE
jgi:hypothetical protein